MLASAKERTSTIKSAMKDMMLLVTQMCYGEVRKKSIGSSNILLGQSLLVKD